MMSILGIVSIVLVLIMVYLVYRLRNMIKTAPGATGKMSTMELIKNWQDQKTFEHEYQNELKLKAQQQARPEIEKILLKKYRDEEIAKATASKGDNVKNSLKNSLGLDSDKIFSDDRMDRMIGRGPGINGGNSHVGSSDKIFSKDRINDMVGKGVNDKKLNSAVGSNIDWDKGVKKSLKNDTNYDGVRKALYNDKAKIVKKKI